MNEIDWLKRCAKILFHFREERRAKVMSTLRKEPVGDRYRDGFARAAESFGFFYEVRRLRAHFFQRTLERRKRRRHIVGVVWEMQNARHFGACLAVRASEGHGQRTFD